MNKNRDRVALLSLLVMSTSAFAMEVVEADKSENLVDTQLLIKTAQRDDLTCSQAYTVEYNFALKRAEIADFTQRFERIVQQYREVFSEQQSEIERLIADHRAQGAVLKEHEAAVAKLREQIDSLPEHANSAGILAESILHNPVTVEKDAAEECFSINQTIRTSLQGELQLREQVIRSQEALLEKLGFQLQQAATNKKSISAKLSTFTRKIQENGEKRRKINEGLAHFNKKYGHIVSHHSDESMMREVEQSIVSVLVEVKADSDEAIEEESKKSFLSSCQIL